MSEETINHEKVFEGLVANVGTLVHQVMPHFVRIYNKARDEYRVAGTIYGDTIEGCNQWLLEQHAVTAMLSDARDALEPYAGEIERLHCLVMPRVENNEQSIRQCIEEIRQRKLALTPANVSGLIKQKQLPFAGTYDELSEQFWRILDDPEWERRYKHIISMDTSRRDE